MKYSKLPNSSKEKQEKSPKSRKRPDFSNPETCRSWKIATREAASAASDRPDVSFDWTRAFYDRHADHSSLRDPGKFVTLDTMLLAAHMKVAKGDSQVQGD